MPIIMKEWSYNMVEINSKYSNDETALIRACVEGHTDIASFLVDMGARLVLIYRIKLKIIHHVSNVTLISFGY